MRFATVLAALAALLLPLLTAGCREPGPAEKAGRAIDDAVEDAGSAVDDALDKAEDELEKAKKSS